MKYNTVYKRNTTATQKHNFEIGKQNKTERKKKANTKIIPTALRTNTINSATTKKCNKLQHKKNQYSVSERCKHQCNNLKHIKIQVIQLTNTKYKNNTIITQTIIHPLPHPLAPLSFSPPFTITQSLTLSRAFTLPPRVINNSHAAVCPLSAAKCSGVLLSCREMRRYT